MTAPEKNTRGRLPDGALRHLSPVRPVTTAETKALALHTDGALITYEIGGRPRRLRDLDEDYALLLCVRQSASGGESVVADGYRLMDRICTHPRTMELGAFLTGVDVDCLAHALWQQTYRGTENCREGSRLEPRSASLRPRLKDDVLCAGRR